MDLNNTALQDRLPAILPFKFPGIPKVHCAFTTGLYGNISLDFELTGQNDKNRRKLLAEYLEYGSWTELRQVHGNTLLVNPAPTSFDCASTLEADGCCTSKPGQAMLSKSADCQQILLAHISGEYVAALHVGWKGNRINFPGSGVTAFCKAYSISPTEVMAVRGPSLGPQAAEFINYAEEWPQNFNSWFDPTSKCMNLWQLTRDQLAEAGIKPENIFTLDWCTYSLPEFFFSFRRGHTGRQAAIIYIKK